MPIDSAAGPSTQRISMSRRSGRCLASTPVAVEARYRATGAEGAASLARVRRVGCRQIFSLIVTVVRRCPEWSDV